MRNEIELQAYRKETDHVCKSLTSLKAYEYYRRQMVMTYSFEAWS